MFIAALARVALGTQVAQAMSADASDVVPEWGLIKDERFEYHTEDNRDARRELHDKVLEALGKFKSPNK